jgi:hypothetical protein
MRRVLLSAFLVALLSLVAASCSINSGQEKGPARLLVTRDFGERRVLTATENPIESGETVMRLLLRSARIKTRYGGRFVNDVNGIASKSEDTRRFDWFYYVNGIEADVGAAERKVQGNDRVWWDYHDWTSVMRVPAVVGSFPEPFVHGIDGKRLPVRIECATPGSDPCRQVTERLASYEVPAAIGGLLTARVEDTLRVLVGPWQSLRDDHAVDGLERGPKTSGVYARIARDGRTITALDAAGRTARRLGPGTGLVAATAIEDEHPTWVVTGTDDAGVTSAARAFEEGTLENRFALAVSNDLPVPLPVAR